MPTGISVAMLAASLVATPSAHAEEPAPGIVQGTITETETGAPLPQACAHFYDVDWIEAVVA
jgi:hypothetical protein